MQFQILPHIFHITTYNNSKSYTHNIYNIHTLIYIQSTTKQNTNKSNFPCCFQFPGFYVLSNINNNIIIIQFRHLEGVPVLQVYHQFPPAPTRLAPQGWRYSENLRHGELWPRSQFFGGQLTPWQMASTRSWWDDIEINCTCYLLRVCFHYSWWSFLSVCSSYFMLFSLQSVDLKVTSSCATWCCQGILNTVKSLRALQVLDLAGVASPVIGWSDDKLSRKVDDDFYTSYIRLLPDYPKWRWELVIKIKPSDTDYGKCVPGR